MISNITFKAKKKKIEQPVFNNCATAEQYLGILALSFLSIVWDMGQKNNTNI